MTAPLGSLGSCEGLIIIVELLHIRLILTRTDFDHRHTTRSLKNIMSSLDFSWYSYAGRILESNEFHVAFCFLCGVSSLLPIILQFPSNLEKSLLRSSLSTSHEFTNICVATIALVIPLSFDLFLDLLTISLDASRSAHRKKINRAAKETPSFNFLNKAERFLILLGFITISLVGFLSKSTHNLALIYICCNKCQFILTGGAIAISLCRYDKEYWSVRTTLISLFLFGFGLAGSPYIDNIYAGEDPVSFPTLVMDNFIYYLSVAPCLLFLFNCFRWLIVAYFKATSWRRILMCSSDVRLQSPDALQTSHGTNAQDHTFFPMVYTFCSVAITVMILAIAASSARLDQYDTMNLLENTVPFLLFIILITTLSMRVVKFEVVQGLVSHPFHLITCHHNI